MNRRGLAVLAGLLAFGDAAFGESFRCGPWIVSEDVSVPELLEKCGEPTQKSSETTEVTGRVRGGTTTTEKWTYDRGSQAPPMVVTIVDGKIKSMERGEH